jgi:hypothetical protein
MGWLDRFANLDSASGSEVLAFFSLTPAFSPVDTPHSAQLSRFNGFRMLTTQATQRSRITGLKAGVNRSERGANDYSSTGAIESDPITGVLPGPRFVVMNCSSAFLKPG